MRQDAFSRCHPAVTLLYFLGAVLLSFLLDHPACLLAGVCGAGAYYLRLKGKAGGETLLGLLLFFLVLTAVNPWMNTQGKQILFALFGRPYTLEALLYGAALAASLVTCVLWCGCYSCVMTEDRFTALFGNTVPTLSLLLVMVLRLVPALQRKAAQIAGARRCVGKGGVPGATNREKLQSGFSVLSALTSWALEGSVTTADAMRCRGYGTGRRTAFSPCVLRLQDGVLLAVQILLFAALCVLQCTVSGAVTYTPVLSVPPLTGQRLLSLVFYGLYLAIPTAMGVKEDIQWHISKSKM